MSIKRAKRLIRMRKKLENSKSLGFMGHRFAHKNLWIASYNSVARGVFVGTFWMMIPIPLQMTPVIVSCIMLRANIPTAVANVWLSNPFTWVPMYFGNYLFGCYLLDINVHVDDWSTFTSYMLAHLADFWKPLFLGSFVAGLFVATSAFISIYLLKFFSTFPMTRMVRKYILFPMKK